MENVNAIKVGKNDRDCPKCGKVLASGSGLKKHMEDRHTASDGFACAVCGKWNKTRNSLVGRTTNGWQYPAKCPSLFIYLSLSANDWRQLAHVVH